MQFLVAVLTLLTAILVDWVFSEPIDVGNPQRAYRNDNLTSRVEWDPDSLIVDGQRVFIFSAEFHYQRLPVPELWPDVFQKFKSQGFNAISVYFFWYYHSATPGEFDFETAGKNVERLFDAAKDAGLWVITRAGPYCNAETNGGGLALYLADGSGGNLRTSDNTFYRAWLPWINAVGRVIAANQITQGGPVILNQIENELTETVHEANNTLVLYMEQVENAFQNVSVQIPSTSNEKGMRGMSWSTDFENVGGTVDVYGLDSYPGGTSCTNPSSGYHVVRNYYQWFQNTSFAQPEFFPEFEAGYLRGWGTSNYDSCESELSPEFPDVYYKNNIGQRNTLLSLYMGYGGTNWGHSAAPVVYTSYDYSAPLSEERIIRDKMKQVKLIGLFTRVSKGLLTADMVGNGTSYTTGAEIWTWELRNTLNGAGFLVVQQNDTSSMNNTTFALNFRTSHGNVTVSDVALAGRQSKIVVTDYSFGSHKLLYSTSEILTYATLGSDVLVLYLDEGQSGEFAFQGTFKQNSFKTYGPNDVSANSTGNYTVFRYTQKKGTTVVQFNDSRLMYLLDQVTAWSFHAPSLTTSPAVSAGQHFFVLGPYLVRSGNVADGIASVIGDLNTSATVEVFTGNLSANVISWNGRLLETSRTLYGSLMASIPAPETQKITIPQLSNWKTHDSLPERLPAYDDSNWTICNKTTTLSPVHPLSLPVLFSADYAFFAGPTLYRAHFPTSAAPQSLNLTAQHGFAAGWSVWLNGIFVASYPGNASAQTSSLLIPLLSPSNSTSLITRNATENVLTVLIDYSGHDETSTAHGVANPRGLLGALPVPPLNSTTNSTTLPSFTWRIQGQPHTSLRSLALDPARGSVNTGGLCGERRGWHLPGYPISTWASGSPTTGLSSAGVAWYATDFALSVPSNIDMPISIVLANATADPIRVQVYVNGYLIAKFWPYLGPQARFPVQPGVLDTQGTNRVAVMLWAQGEGGGRLGGIEIVADRGAWESGFDFGSGAWGYLRPGWEELKGGYE